MTKRTTTFLFWITVAITFLGQVVLIWALLRSNTSTLEKFGWFTGAVLPFLYFLFDQLQKRSLQVFLLINRVKAAFSKSVTQWQIAANFYNPAVNKESMDLVSAALMEEYGSQNISISNISAAKRVVQINRGPAVSISYEPSQPSYSGDEDIESPLVRVEIGSNYRVGYFQASRVIKNEILPALNTISRALGGDAQYRMNIEFDKGKNPFFGLYISQIPPETVSNYYIKLSPNNSRSDSVMISQDKLSINTRSQTSLQNLALEFLTFDYELQGHLPNG